MTGVTLAGLLVEAADPAQVARFWSQALGGETRTLLDGGVRVSASGPELTFYPQARPKSVKNRVHFDAYARSVDPTRRRRGCSRSARTATGPRNWRRGGRGWWVRGSATAPTANRAGCTDRPAGRS